MPPIKPKTAMLYGDSDRGKTSNLYFMAKYILAKYPGTTGRLITCGEGGYAPFQASGMIDNGMVDVFDVSSSTRPLGDVRKLSEGYWPRKYKSGKTYFKADANCETTEEDWKTISFVFIEGASALCACYLDQMANSPEKIGFKRAFVHEEEGYIFGQVDEGHYGIAQRELRKVFVYGFKNLPTRYQIWTSLQGTGQNRHTKETVWGPASCGTALTGLIPSWFEECFRLTEVVDDEGKLKRAAYFINHNDQDTGILCLCKSRVLPEQVRTLRQEYPGGYVSLGLKRGIDKYYEFVEGLGSGMGVGEEGKTD